MTLLDTHVLVWLAVEPRKLSRKASAAVRRGLSAGGLGVASISVWEVAQLFARGRLRRSGTIEASVEELVRETRVAVREITPTIAALACQLPAGFPGDPADRLIAATAMAEGSWLVTSDERIRACPLVRTLW